MSKGISGITLTEAEVKRGCEDYLEVMRSQGKLWFCRLNAGDFIEVRGDIRRRIKGAPAGTADLIVIQPGNIQIFHAMQRKIHKEYKLAFVTFVECKSTKGKATKKQNEFEEFVTGLHCRYVVVRSVDELIEILGSWND
jgi:hypothetical protein